MESGREFSSSDGARDVRFVNGDPLRKFVVPSNQAQEIVPNGTVGGIENVEISQWNGYLLAHPPPMPYGRRGGMEAQKKIKMRTTGQGARFTDLQSCICSPPSSPNIFHVSL